MFRFLVNFLLISFSFALLFLLKNGNCLKLNNEDTMKTGEVRSNETKNDFHLKNRNSFRLNGKNTLEIGEVMRVKMVPQKFDFSDKSD